MTDLFKSAFGYFSNTSNNSVNNEFVGQIVEVGNVKLRVKSTIAEGGFAFVFVAQALDSGKEYALKRLLAADEEAERGIVQEVNILKKLANHPNIIQFISAAVINKQQTGHGMSEYLLLTELCSGGSLVEYLQKQGGAFKFSPEVITQIMWQVCKAVQHMHSQVPPIIHRDLKIENLLISQENKIKLCDFGSATTQVYRPDSSWSAQQRTLLEDQMAKCTTPMYRAPEMVDTWENKVIGPPADVWALGCLFYFLCYSKHPFEDSAKLRILNANYTFPSDSTYKCFNSLISGCLNVQPSERLTVPQILERIAAISETLRINPSEPVSFPSSTPMPASTHHQSLNENTSSPIRNSAPNHPRPPPPHQSPRHAPPPPFSNHSSNPPSSATPGYPETSGRGFLSQIKGGAGSFFKNLKDTSSKVVQSVQQTMVRIEEISPSYITSRICVINYTDGPDTLHDLRSIVQSRHNLFTCAIYNLTPTAFPPNRFPNATVVEGNWGKKCPSLQALYTMCEHMYHFLSNNQSNVCFVVCSDGKCSSAMLVCAFLLFVGFVYQPQDALQLFAVKRIPPTLQPSHQRYLDYFSQVISNPLPTFTCSRVRIMSLVLHPVPLFNKVRDGCRPFIEVFQGEDLVFSSLDEYERMVAFSVNNAKAVLPVRCSVFGDVTVSVYHARQVLTRITPIKMLQIQFNTSFTNESVIHFTRHELDDTVEGADHYTDNLMVTLNCEEGGDPFTINSPWAKHQPLNSSILFTTKLEADETTDTFVPKRDEERTRPPPPRPAPPRPPRPPPSPVMQDTEEEKRTEDLLNLGFEKSVVTDDLLNLASEDTPSGGFPFAPPPQPPLTNQVLFDTFITTEPPQESGKENLLGDWGDELSGIPSKGGFTGVGPETVLNMPPQQANLSADPPPLQKNPNTLGNLTNIHRNISSPNLQTDLFEEMISKPKAMSNANSPAKTPNEANYSRVNFESQKTSQPAQGTKKIEDVFGDLLGSQGYDFSNKKDACPRTINEMRREDQVKVLDPDQLKIMDWTEGKKNNLRALLTSLHTVLWADAKWSQCHMHQLVSTAEVKKAYRKACIAVHPDKHIGTPNEKLAKMVFMELNNAWSEFEKDTA